MRSGDGMFYTNARLVGDGLFLVGVDERRPTRECWKCGGVSNSRNCPHYITDSKGKKKECETVKGDEKVSNEFKVRRKDGWLYFDPPLTSEQYNIPNNFAEKIVVAVGEVKEQVADDEGRQEQEEQEAIAEAQAQKEGEAKMMEEEQERLKQEYER